MEIGKDRSAELKRLFRIYKTVIKMMIDRGYFILETFRTMEFTDFEKQFGEREPRDAMTSVFFKREDQDKKIYIFFAPSPNKFTKEDLKGRLEIMKGANCDSAVIVLQGDTSVNLTEFEYFYHIEFFKEEELLVNITEHELVPQHILISDNEKLELLKKYKVHEIQLPKILINDPIARYYGLKRGNVVKIVRESETAGKYVTYRRVS